MKDGGRRHLPFELHENSGRIATGTFGRTVTIEWPLEIFKQMSGNCKRAARLQLLCRNSVIKNISGNFKRAARLQLPPHLLENLERPTLAIAPPSKFK